MSLIPVTIKHSGKPHSLTLDASQPPKVFKDAIYQSTGVPIDRMKVMIKGGTLKDDDWGKLVLKDGMNFMVIGAAGELPKAPEKQTVFLEDLDDEGLAAALALPTGLVNLGNTCYMNATIQALRAIPELQTSLAIGSLDGAPGSLNGLYTSMSRTTEAYVPAQFLNVMRQNFPQFAERSRASGNKLLQGFAQQDAEECYSQIIGSLRDIPAPNAAGKKFVEAYMTGRVRRELKCDEAPEEPSTISKENVLKIECNISLQTHFMASGIKESLDQKVEKRSLTLNRDAIYSQHSRFERLPTYLTVHMVRFAWKREIAKKSKIMRKVKFPTEYDALDLVTDELKEKLQPVSRRLMEIETERKERRKVRKRTKGSSTTAATSVSSANDVDMANGEEKPEQEQEGGRLAPESVFRERERTELDALISSDVKEDFGASATGLYDLVAIITHKGAAADAGHYIAFVKRSVFSTRHSEQEDSATASVDEDDEDWYKFDDDKVSVFPAEKLATLDGGGEDASAYVLLYKSKSVA